MELQNEGIKDRWRAFECGSRNLRYATRNVSLDHIYNHWRTHGDEQLTSKQMMLFRIPKLLNKLHENLSQRHRRWAHMIDRYTADYEPYIPTEIFQSLLEFHQSDVEMRESGLTLLENPKYWQGYTGAESAIFVQAITQLLEDPESFLDTAITEVYRRKLDDAGLKCMKCSPAVIRAEEIRSQYIGCLIPISSQQHLEGGES